MTSDHIQTPTPSAATRQPARGLLVAAAMTAAIGLFFLLREHWVHVGSYWPYMILLACPVMHLFHGHGAHGRRDGPAERSNDRAK
jgi:hypothetical protein